VNDGEKKCVVVAVWTGPMARNRGFLENFKEWLIFRILCLWMLMGNIYYNGAGMNATAQELPLEF